MRRYFLLIAVAVCLCGFDRDTKDVTRKVVAAANEKANSFLANIPVGSESQFGFTNRDEIKVAKLGTPYRVLTLSRSFYDAQNVQVPFANSFITAGNAWRVPVVAEGTSRVLIMVNVANGVYTAGDMGGAGIAKELQQLMRKPQKGHTYSLLKVYELSSDFLVDMPGSSLNDAIFIPFSSARMALPALSDKSHYTLMETLDAIKKKMNQ